MVLNLLGVAWFVSLNYDWVFGMLGFVLLGVCVAVYVFYFVGCRVCLELVWGFRLHLLIFGVLYC